MKKAYQQEPKNFAEVFQYIVDFIDWDKVDRDMQLPDPPKRETKVEAYKRSRADIMRKRNDMKKRRGRK